MRAGVLGGECEQNRREDNSVQWEKPARVCSPTIPASPHALISQVFQLQEPDSLEAQLRQSHQRGGRQATLQCPLCRPGSSPGSRVQSSRGAVREMQLRFLSTLLRMVPTPPPPPPPPPPPCRFRHLPPRLREPVSLSCRIGERPGILRSAWVPAAPLAAPLAQWLGARWGLGELA